MASLLICTVLYILVVAVLTGMQRYDQINTGAGVSMAFASAGMQWAEVIVAIAGMAGITSVLLVDILSRARVLLAMARDGRLPPRFFAAVHPKFRTPWKGTILVGLFVAAGAAFLPLGMLLHMANIGTLFAFATVCAAVLIMRKTNPTAPRPFRCPLVPVISVLGILMCLLMFSLPTENWVRLVIWLVRVFRGDLRWATRIASRIGSAFAILLSAAGVMLVLLGDFVGGIWFFIIGLFLRSASQTSYEQLLIRQALAGHTVRRLMHPDPVAGRRRCPLSGWWMTPSIGTITNCFRS